MKDMKTKEQIINEVTDYPDSGWCIGRSKVLECMELYANQFKTKNKIKTKTAYTALGMLFDSKDLALISTNTMPIEITVPESVFIRTGKIEIGDSMQILGKKSIQLNPVIDDFDCSELCDYIPSFRVEMDMGKLYDFNSLDGVNYCWHDLSEGLQEDIEEYCKEQWGHEYEFDEHFMTDLNED